MVKVIFLLVFLFVWCYAQNTPCTDPAGKAAVCKPLKDCPSLMALGREAATIDDQIRRMQPFLCSPPGVNVCCPSDPVCYTPDGKEGVLSTLTNCPHLLNMRKQKSNMNFVYNSIRQLSSSTKPQVCCGAPPSPVQFQDCHGTMSSFPPDPESGCCGIDAIADSKIFGGISASIDEHPWLVLLEYRTPRGDSLDCAGSLISGRYVLTAAHCFKKSNPYKVRIGEYDTDHDGPDCKEVSGGGEDCTDGAESVDIEKIIIHPEYNKTSHFNDIALIRLSKNVNFTDFVRPLCLPTGNPLQDPNYLSLRASVAGWGKMSVHIDRSRIKQHLVVPMVDMPKCQREYTRSIKPPPMLFNRQLCAGGEPGKDSCNGDSGGPLMVRTNSAVGDPQYYGAGVVSFGSSHCGTPGLPGVYTNTFAYNTWIRSHIML